MKDGEGTNRRAFMHDPYDPWTRTPIWRMSEGGEGLGLGRDGQRERKQNQDNFNSINNTKMLIYVFYMAAFVEQWQG